MNASIKFLILCSLSILFLVACQSNTNNKKVEPATTEQIAGEISKNLPSQPAEKDHPGKAVYDANCLTCHQADGSGVPNMHPPLTPGSWVGKEPAELIAIMMKGLSGKIEVNGEEYNDFMPSQASLTDDEIAQVLSYIRSNFGNNFSPVTPAMVAKIRSGR